MFASVALAARIDRAETRLTESLGRALVATVPESRAFVEAIGGGVAAYAGRSSPMNKSHDHAARVDLAGKRPPAGLRAALRARDTCQAP